MAQEAVSLPPGDKESFEADQRHGFRVVRAFLASQVSAGEATQSLPPNTGLHGRLIDAIEGLQSGRTGSADVAALLASVVRREAALAPTGGAKPYLSISGAMASELGGALHPAGLESVPAGSMVVLTARGWDPQWLDASPLDAVDAVERRLLRVAEPKADAFFRDALGHDRYASVGQQLAARCVELSPDASTILVSLPTGTGKSAVGLFGGLQQRARGTTVVVVPTISLARDQETHLREALDRGDVGRALTHRDFAYLGGSDETVRAEIRARIADGKQGVVFLAPESLRGEFLGALRDAALQGFVTDFVVDEAHTVSGWGVDFRPDFQTISGVRRGLLEVCPVGRTFRTILLSATITQHASQLLMRLFGAEVDGSREPGFEYTAVEGALRPEPTYFMADCADESERTERVVEALRVLPRPAIVYVTNPSHADRLVGELKLAGFARVVAYSGTSNASERRIVERGWRGEAGRTEYDVVVATSAFGLGIDQRDVRAIVHAYTPETASRFYQEVGRGGRDGRACLSLLLTNQGDVGQCRRLALATYPRFVVRSRWDSMFQNRVSISGDRRVWVDLDDVRPELRARGVTPGERKNRGWNQRVLTLLQDAGLIALDTPVSQIPPPQIESPIGVRILRTDMLEEEWNRPWEAARKRGMEESAADFGSMRALVTVQGCVAREVSARFALSMDTRTVAPASVCNGCPWCRRHGENPWAERVWAAASAATAPGDSERMLARLLRVAPGRVLAVVADPVQRPAVIEAALQISPRRGAVLAAEPSLIVDAKRAMRRDRPGLADEGGTVSWLPVPGVVDVIVAGNELPDWALTVEDAVLRVLVVSRETCSPRDPHRSLAEMRPVPVLYADQFVSLLS